MQPLSCFDVSCLELGQLDMVWIQINQLDLQLAIGQTLPLLRLLDALSIRSSNCTNGQMCGES